MYKYSIGLEAEAVPASLWQWLENGMPVDYTAKPRTRFHIRLIEVTITGTTPAEIQHKQMALIKTVRCGGFCGAMMKDRKITKI